MQFEHFVRNKLQEILNRLHTIEHRLERIERRLEPRLTRIQITFEGDSMPNPGPFTFTAAGVTEATTIVGFDQFGNPWTGPIPTASYAIDNPAVATVDANGGVTSVANGTANVTASLNTAEGLALSDVEQVIVNIPITPPPTPVLSSIKLQFN